MSAPFMQLYVADYLGDTRHLTTEQHGAYLLLLMTMWRADGRLPLDDGKLARLTGCTASRWAKIRDEVLAFFIIDGDEITHGRLMFELEKASEKSIKRAEAGSHGGNAKARKDKASAVANATPLPCHSSEPEPDKSKEPTVLCPTRSDGAPIQQAFEEWNAVARRHGLPLALDLTPNRRKQIKARLTDGGIDAWRAALQAVERSGHCRGENDRGWRADLDFVCQPKSFSRLREGFYAPKGAAVVPINTELRARHEAMLRKAG